ncbi:hypothetical protein PHO31112_05326 [Pandoraea horticolens]|uniref:Uncharacterized protein n=1 Tax=Pandoraea horticolens TaxID=2508298 RepID=A0A5E4ZBT2_9BURK|nr:hypothetical protein [Pandoraea horticolens]VVE58476.1 hypothetical protein PHO31112_05326 [Pandoraea horticolens]
MVDKNEAVSDEAVPDFYSGRVTALDYSQTGSPFPGPGISGPSFAMTGKSGGIAVLSVGVNNASSTALTFMLSTALLYSPEGVQVGGVATIGFGHIQGVSLFAKPPKYILVPEK